jgi:hypothetical protein
MGFMNEKLLSKGEDVLMNNKREELFELVKLKKFISLKIDVSQ